MKSKVAIYGGFAGSENALSERPVSHPSSTTLSGNLGIESLDIDNSYHVLTSVDVDSTALLDGLVITGGTGRISYGSPPASDEGGGLYAIRSDLRINNCFFVANKGTALNSYYMHAGGGYPTQNSVHCRLTNCTFQSNDRAISMGNQKYNSTTFVITNCVFQNNHLPDAAGSYGGAIFIGESCYVLIVNSSFLNNYATYGGVLAVYITSGYFSYVEMVNCIAFGSGGQPGYENFYALPKVRYSLSDRALPGSDSTNLLVTNSPFVSANSTQLAPCSPAVDAGDPTTTTAVIGHNELATTTAVVGSTDLAGNPRIVRGRIDMGAYEFQGTPCIAMYTLHNGQWDDPATWSEGRLPNPTDILSIEHSVTIPQNYVATAHQLVYKASARLIYEAGGRLRLGQ